MATRRTERTPARAAGTGRQARATSRLAAGAEGEEQEEAPAPGAGIAEAVGIVAFLLLVSAFVLMDMYRGKSFGTGLFFGS